MKKSQMKIIALILMILLLGLAFPVQSLAATKSDASFILSVSSETDTTPGDTVSVVKGEKFYVDVYISNMKTATDSSGINYGLYAVSYNADQFSINTRSGIDYQIGKDVVSGWTVSSVKIAKNGKSSFIEATVGDPNYGDLLLFASGPKEYHMIRFVFTALTTAEAGIYDFTFLPSIGDQLYTQAGTYDSSLIALDASNVATTFLSTSQNATVSVIKSAYEISYNGNNSSAGAAPSDENSPYPSGSTASVLGNTGSLEKTGFTFGGWNTKQDGSGTSYQPGDSIKMDKDIKLYARWNNAETTKEISYNSEDWGAANPSDYVIAYDKTSNTIIPTGLYDKSKGVILYFGNNSGTVAGKYNFVQFPDVTDSLWSSGYIWFDAARGVINGMGDGNFCPENNVTRAQFVKMLAAMTPGLDYSKYAASNFKDVPSGTWYGKYINWASSNGIVSGYGNGAFGPENPITREQACVMMRNYAHYLGYGFAETKDKADFADQSSISTWAAGSVATLQTSGFITGKGSNIFDPSGLLTRGEIATITCEFLRSIIMSQNNPSQIQWQQ